MGPLELTPHVGDRLAVWEVLKHEYLSSKVQTSSQHCRSQKLRACASQMNAEEAASWQRKKASGNKTWGSCRIERQQNSPILACFEARKKFSGASSKQRAASVRRP